MNGRPTFSGLLVTAFAVVSLACPAPSKGKDPATKPADIAQPPPISGLDYMKKVGDDLDKPLEELKKLPQGEQDSVINLILRIGDLSTTPDKTIARMKNVLVLRPEALIAHLYIARSYARLNKKDESYAEIEQVLKAHSLPLGQYLKCVELLLDLGKLDEAEERARPLSEQKPPYAGGMYLYAEILRKNHKLREAETEYRRIIELKTDTGASEFHNPAGAKLYLGEILLETKRYPESEKWLLEAADTFRDSPRPFQDLTELYVATGDKEKARRFLGKFKQTGGDPKVYNDLAQKIG